MTLPSPRLHPDPVADIILPQGGSVVSPPRMVTNFCHRATGDRDAPCTCGMCDRAPATDPAAAADRGDWRLVVWVPLVFAVAALRWVRVRVGVALIDLGARILPETGP